MKLLIALLLAQTTSFPIQADFAFYRDNLHNLMGDINQSLSLKGMDTFSTFEIEGEKIIHDASGQELLLVDFSLDNGYIVFGPNKTIQSFSTTGDLFPFFQSTKIILHQDGFYCGMKKINPNGDDSDYSNCRGTVGANAAVSSYPIEYGDALSFLETKYMVSASQWIILSQDKLDYLPSTCSNFGYRQYNESVYHRYESSDGHYYSEGNCGYVSLANVFAYFSSSVGYPGFAARDTYSPLIVPADEADWFNSINHGDFVPKSYPIFIHRLTYDLRELIKNDGVSYSPVDGMYASGVQYCFEHLAQEAGYEDAFLSWWDPYGTGNAYTLSLLQAAIQDDTPLVLFAIGDESDDNATDGPYGNHFMMITGYRTYFGSLEIAGFIYPMQVILVSVFDGHSNNERWYDINSLSSLPSQYYQDITQRIALLSLEY